MINCIKSYELAKEDEDSKLTNRFSNTEIICGLEKNTLVNDGREGMTGVDSRENRTAIVDSQCNQYLQEGLFHRGTEK